MFKITPFQNHPNNFFCNKSIDQKYQCLSWKLLLIPISIITILYVFLLLNHVVKDVQYIQFQKNWFLFLNKKLSYFDDFQLNITQFGDAFIFLSCLSVLIKSSPRLWKSLFFTLIFGGIFSKILKDCFKIPRPAEYFGSKSFVIVGCENFGFSSLPSGHSITVFSILTVLYFSFLPKPNNKKILYVLGLSLFGLLVALSRVAVGAHYPLDTIFGGLIGIFCGIIGILVSNKVNIPFSVNSIKNQWILLSLLFVSTIIILFKFSEEQLFVYFICLTCLFYAIYGFFKNICS